MRIVSYNIFNGGEGRADPVAEVIESQRPDIVALVEADDSAVLERIGRRLGMDFIVAAGSVHSAALLSRWPIVETINHAALRPETAQSCLEAWVQEPGGPPWRVAVAHLHPGALDHDETARQGEIEAVLKLFAPYRAEGQPHLLVGDFNAHSPRQRIDLLRCKPTTRQAYEANGGQIPRQVVGCLLEAGYVDSFDQLYPAGAEGTFSTQFPGQRVDYIFTYGIEPSRLAAAWIERDRLAKYASDHFPIGAEIR